ARLGGGEARAQAREVARAHARLDRAAPGDALEVDPDELGLLRPGEEQVRGLHVAVAQPCAVETRESRGEAREPLLERLSVRHALPRPGAIDEARDEHALAGMSEHGQRLGRREAARTQVECEAKGALAARR